MNKLFAFLSLFALAGGCGGGSGPSGPPRLWLALNGDELHVKLQAAEPHPY